MDNQNYDDFSDIESILNEQYPVSSQPQMQVQQKSQTQNYDDFSDIESILNEPPVNISVPQKTGMDKAVNTLGAIFGGNRIGEGIGTLSARSKARKGQGIEVDYSKLTPESIARLQARGVPINVQDQRNENAQQIKGPTALQLAGDVGRIATNFIPSGAATKGLSTLAKVGQAVKYGVATGAAAGLTGSVADKKPLGGVVKDTLIGGTAGGVLGGALVGGGALVSKASSVSEAFKPEAIMQRVARIPKSSQEKFNKSIGENVGEYLVNRGIYGNDEEIITQLYQRFNNSKNQADIALETLKGTYKPVQIKTALRELLQRERAISSPGAISKDYRTVGNLINKYKGEGLTMSDINQVKRLYESNVKLDYLKTPGTLATTVQRANNLDSAIRSWQMSKAKELGLQNLDIINKETRASRTLADELYKQNVGTSGNNALSLTDAVLLAGGDPTSVGMLLARKTFGSKKVQSAIAKSLVPNVKIGEITAEFGTPKPGLEAFNASLEKKAVPQLKLPVLQKPLPKVSPEIVEKASVSKQKGIFETAIDNLKDPNKRQAGFVKAFTNDGDLTTKILKDLEGKTTVSKQYILDATNRGELKQVERDITRQVLEDMPDGQINVQEFADKIRNELLPLKVNKARDMYSSSRGGTGQRYENIALPDELRGSVKNYEERIYESPIKTSAGQVHFGQPKDGVENYFGHTRIEDMADNKTRRVIEVQSDLYQKGNLEREFPKSFSTEEIEATLSKSELAKFKKAEADYGWAWDEQPNTLKAQQSYKELSEKAQKILSDKVASQKSKLQQYNDPTAHFRMVREEVKKAAQDGKTKLQFPTGETAMKIEGLGERNTWNVFNGSKDGSVDINKLWTKLEPDNLKVGQTVNQGDGENWIITDILGDGKFKAVPKSAFEGIMGKVDSADIASTIESLPAHQIENMYPEQFDISGKVDTNNPIYKFYEKDVQKYLNKFGGKKVVDDKGVSWIEIPITKEQGKMPVEAFGKIKLGPLFGVSAVGAGGVAASAVAKKYIPKNKK